MIVSINEARRVYNLLPPEKKSFYYHPDYLIEDVKNKKGLEICFFVIQEGNNIFYHGFYKGRVLNTNLYDIQSPYGYGGPIIIGDEKFKRRATDMYLEWCKGNNILVEFIRFHPMLKNEETYYGKKIFNRSTVYINLKESSIIKTFSTRARTAIKKAKKNNVTISFIKNNTNIESFIEIYNKLMADKHTTGNYFFDKDYYINLLKSPATVLVSALDVNKNIIASSMFFLNEKISEYHLSASTEVGKELSATHLILYEFAEYAKKHDCEFLYLGGGNSSEENNSLLFFKKGFSKKESSFYIGYKIHLEKAYKDLKENYAMNNKVLFYREV